MMRDWEQQLILRAADTARGIVLGRTANRDGQQRPLACKAPFAIAKGVAITDYLQTVIIWPGEDIRACAAGSR